MAYDLPTNPYPHSPKVYGPFTVDVRSKIPKQVLSLVNSYDYGVGITIEFTETYRKVYWRLEDTRKNRDPLRPVLCVGGDGIEGRPGVTEFALSPDPASLMQKSVPIWPHCKLPSRFF